MFGPGSMQQQGAPQAPGQPRQGVYGNPDGSFAEDNDLSDSSGGGFFSKLFSWKGLTAIAVVALSAFGIKKFFLSGAKEEAAETLKKAETQASTTGSESQPTATL
jgi:hypothetical protein